MRVHETAVVYANAVIDPSASIGPYAVIGYPGSEEELKSHHRDMSTLVSANVTIDPFVILYQGARLQPFVHVDAYSRVGRNTDIGTRTSIVYGSRIHDDVVIGEDCVIAGNVSNRVRLGDRVMHHGRLAHRYNRPHEGWHEVDEPSMTIGDDVVIGAGSVLIGNIRVGDHVYIAAGEIVRHDIPQYSMVYGDQIIAAADWKGSLGESGFWAP